MLKLTSNKEEYAHMVRLRLNLSVDHRTYLNYGVPQVMEFLEEECRVLLVLFVLVTELIEL